MSGNVTTEATVAAQEAFAKVYNDPATLAGCLDAALDAAAPLIAAAERELTVTDVREHLREIVAANAARGSDILLSALLEALRELSVADITDGGGS